MAKKCYICGKGPQRGYRVSHAHNRNKAVWYPNLQKVRILVNGKPKKVYVCTSCLKAGKVVKI